MDPIANITETRQLAASLLTPDPAGAEEEHESFREAATRLAELVQALDEWRTTGGFDPYGALTRAEVVDLMRTHWQDPVDFHSEIASRLTIDESEYAPEDE